MSIANMILGVWLLLFREQQTIKVLVKAGLPAEVTLMISDHRDTMPERNGGNCLINLNFEPMVSFYLDGPALVALRS
jgi:hypothetical protein